MTRLTDKELDLIRRERAATQHTAATSSSRNSGLLASAIASVTQALRRRRTIAELSRLDDHMLRDIGLERGGLESVAEALSARDAATQGGLIARLRRWNTRRQTINELEALDDRALADIGIVRAEIPELVDRTMREAAAKQTAPARLESLVTDIRVAAHREALRPGAASTPWHGMLVATHKAEKAA